MNVAKYILEICQDDQDQLDNLLKYKEYLNLDTHKEDCGCVFCLVEQKGLEQLRVYLHICILHLFENKIIVDKLQERHRTCNFKPLKWNE